MSASPEPQAPGSTGATHPRIAVVGAGAIGGYLAARLARAGHPVSVVQRGAALDVLRDQGLTLLDGTDSCKLRVNVLGRCSDLGEQDIVFLTVKATGLHAVAADLAALLGPRTRLVPVLNGIPWWYARALDADSHRRVPPDVLRCLDPDGVIASALPVGRVIGCVAHMAAQVRTPGVVQLVAPGPLILGTPNGRQDAGLQALACLLEEAGVATRVTADIRGEIWTKLVGNLAFNPISALTGARMNEIFENPGLTALARSLMHEGMRVGQSLGIRFTVNIDQRMEMARAIGPAKLSMLQDLEAGRPLEVDAIVGCVLALADHLNLPAPALRMTHALISERDRHAASSPSMNKDRNIK